MLRYFNKVLCKFQRGTKLFSVCYSNFMWVLLLGGARQFLLWDPILQAKLSFSLYICRHFCQAKAKVGYSFVKWYMIVNLCPWVPSFSITGYSSLISLGNFQGEWLQNESQINKCLFFYSSLLLSNKGHFSDITKSFLKLPLEIS